MPRPTFDEQYDELYPPVVETPPEPEPELEFEPPLKSKKPKPTK